MKYIEEVKIHKHRLIMSMRNKVNEDADCLSSLVDELAESASNPQGQGLILFLQTRTNFINKVEELRSQYINLLCVTNTDESDSAPRV
jgi:hypothetical protein